MRDETKDSLDRCSGFAQHLHLPLLLCLLLPFLLLHIQRCFPHRLLLFLLFRLCLFVHLPSTARCDQLQESILGERFNLVLFNGFELFRTCSGTEDNVGSDF